MVGFAGVGTNGDATPGPVVVLATRSEGSEWAMALTRQGHAVALCGAADAAIETSRVLGGCPVLVGEGFFEIPPDRAVALVRAADPTVPLLALLRGHGVLAQRVVDAGADDVLALSDDPVRVSGRLRSLVRHRTPRSPHHFGTLTLDPRARTARAGAAVVELRPREFGVLLHLVHAGGRTVPFEELQDVQWADQQDGEAAMRSCVYRLRKALSDHPDLDVEIETVRNRGYRLRALEAAGAA
ncbi:MAG: winged helix-turn-helix domain-containing protein [Longimicrobiales bacterium]